MATFEELMEKFRNPGENDAPPTPEEIFAAHTEELSIRDAAVTDREAELERVRQEKAAADAEVLRMKAVNYDLMRAAPKPGEPENQDNRTEKTDRPRGISALFE